MSLVFMGNIFLSQLFTGCKMEQKQYLDIDIRLVWQTLCYHNVYK